MNSGRLPKARWSPLLPAEAPSGNRDYVARTKVWRWKGDGGWHFANLSVKQSAEIKARFGSTARGWGSIRTGVGNFDIARPLSCR